MTRGPREHAAGPALLVEEAARYVPPGAEILDVGCGGGLAEHRLPPGIRYTGLDASPDLIAACRRRHAGRAGFAFQVADTAAADLGTGRYDVVAILGAATLPGLDVVGLLRRARAALRPGGLLLVGGPTSSGDPAREDGGPGCRWSVEGMVALLQHLGYARVHAASNGLRGGASYLVVAGA